MMLKSNLPLTATLTASAFLGFLGCSRTSGPLPLTSLTSSSETAAPAPAAAPASAYNSNVAAQTSYANGAATTSQASYPSQGTYDVRTGDMRTNEPYVTGQSIPNCAQPGGYASSALPAGYASSAQTVYYEDPAYTRRYNVRTVRVVEHRPVYEERTVVRRGRSKGKSIAIVAGTAGVGAAIGAIAGGGKGAAIGAIAGGAGGFTYDRLTHNRR
jgi:uncharacterized protein YcfJ